MKRILVLAPDNDPTSFYRAARPWQLISKQLSNEYQIDYRSSKSGLPVPGTWDQAGFYDLVFLQRPFHPEILMAAQYFKRFGAKLWVDEDDLQTNVPWSHNAAYAYMQNDTQKVIRECIAMCDVLTVSTQYLADAYRPMTKAEIVVVPNAFDLEIFPKPQLKPKEKTIIWRGSAPSHLNDLLEIRKELYDVLKANPDWKMYFFGIFPWWYDEMKDEFPEGSLKNMVYVPHTGTLFDYMSMLVHLNPAIWIVPLADTPFNRGRSNLAWLEASWCGAQVIAPCWDEWGKPGQIRNYDSDGKHWFGRLLNAVMHEQDALDYAGLSWNNINANLRLPKVNEKRLNIIKRLIG